MRFPTSCKSSVASRFNRSVALLHSFEFGESIRGFSDVLASDPSCAMAYWGIALSRWSNPMAPGLRSPSQLQSGKAAADAAQRLRERATARERGYIDAVAALYSDYTNIAQPARLLAYERAMASLVEAQPADTEAKIFHALALSASASPADKTYAKQLEAAHILEPIWAKQPNHPGLAHYIIHSYDYPELAGKAKAAADRYARIAPDAAHALHMPSHTFTRVGDWSASVASNLRSMETARRSNSIAETLHAADYAVYAHLQMRRFADAKKILDELPALEARFDPNAITGAAPGSAGVFALAAMPARYVLERHDWVGASKLSPKPTAFPWTEAMLHFARALGAAHTGDRAAASASVDSLDAIAHRLETKGEPYWAEQVAIQTLAARAWLEHSTGRDSAAIEYMRQAAAREDATEKAAVTPGPLLPAHELLGDLMMELSRPAEALAEYRATLRTEPNRYHALDGARRAAAATGNRALADSLAAQLRRITGQSNSSHGDGK